ncbi:hypothetical protein N7447_007959 [Penicillium robsamsonii]|uniref:uncharacterized protein n=1 Tax=Penicillium robsamsonii TaxID=1792511 RepID=UPI002549915E|nr:uncharacterized protein N7447_007959 [Penicillium robsamsonii]KAJ5817951.1 hypothetical protein N7447_007959 [Penicillium robsamsonii]
MATAAHGFPFDGSVYYSHPGGAMIEARRHALIFDSLLFGLVEGQLISKNITHIQSDDPEQQLWIKTEWIYMGRCSWLRHLEHQSSSGLFLIPATGIYKDYCLSIAADHLLDKGYSMV